MRRKYAERKWNYEGEKHSFYADMWKNGDGTDHIVLLSHHTHNDYCPSTRLDFVADKEDMIRFVDDMIELFASLRLDYLHIDGK